MTSDPGNQFLNDVYGDLVAYVNQIGSYNGDIYVSHLAFVNEPTNGAPEPGTLSLMGLGLLGIAARRPRRTKAAKVHA